jgi:hypothetical protein
MPDISGKENDKAADLFIEVFRLMVGGSTTVFQILVGWFSFFFTFQWVAVAFLMEKLFVSEPGKIPNLASSIWWIVSGSFLFFHANGLAAVWQCRVYFRSILSQINSAGTSTKGADIGPQYALYDRCALAMFLALSASGLVWIFLLWHTVAKWVTP